MGTGYTRKDTGNNIADGNVADPDVMDAEFDGIEAAFDSSSGHTHDGTSAGGGAVTVTGPAQEYLSDGTALYPKADNTYDLGKSSAQWKDLYIDGTANIDDLVNDGTATFAGATIADLGTVTTADIDGGTIDDVTITTQDSKFTLQDEGDSTKQVDFQVSGVTSGTTRTFTFPDVTDTLATLTATQTLTNKTLTSPTVNSPTIAGGSISGITDLAIADGGTGASTAAGALSNLGLTATAAEINKLDGATVTTAEINKLDGFTGTVDDLNYAKDLRATGVTTAEFDRLDGLTATAVELNKLDGATVSTTEINYLDGVTSNLQTQLDGKITSVTAGTGLSGGGSSGSVTLNGVTQSTAAWEAGSSTDESVVSPAKVKAAVESLAPVGGGAVHLGSFTPSGSVSTISGLDLSDKELLFIFVNGVSANITSRNLQIRFGSRSYQDVGQVLSNSGDKWTGSITVDLRKGVLASNVIVEEEVPASVLSASYNTSLKSDTSLSFRATDGSLSGNSFEVYGVK